MVVDAAQINIEQGVEELIEGMRLLAGRDGDQGAVLYGELRIGGLCFCFSRHEQRSKLGRNLNRGGAGAPRCAQPTGAPGSRGRGATLALAYYTPAYFQDPPGSGYGFRGTRPGRAVVTIR